MIIGDFPALVDGTTSVSGFTDIVHYLLNHPEGPYSLDSQLSAQQLADSTAYVYLIFILLLLRELLT